MVRKGVRGVGGDEVSGYGGYFGRKLVFNCSFRDQGIRISCF